MRKCTKAGVALAATLTFLPASGVSAATPTYELRFCESEGTAGFGTRKEMTDAAENLSAVAAMYVVQIRKGIAYETNVNYCA